MATNNGTPKDWHDGCLKDQTRNNFIIPIIHEVVEASNISTTMFVGSATGYIPKCVSMLCKDLQQCILIEIDNGRLDFSKTVGIQANKIEYVSKKIEELTKSKQADLIVISNTLMEFKITDEFITALKFQLNNSGKLQIFLPDVLEDVVKQHIKGDEFALKSFIAGHHYMEKNDKFTRQKYKFHAHRYVHLISMFTERGFVLSKLKISKTTPKQVYLEFVR